MFFGQFRVIVGNDRQLVVPEPYRGIFADGAYITRGFDKNLLIMSSKVFQEQYQRMATLNIADPAARLLLRLILGNTAKIEMNSSGQVLIPEDLAAFAGLEKESILLGQGNYIEVWAPEDWEKQVANSLDVEANAGRFAQLNLAL
jgi:MraZ protein